MKNRVVWVYGCVLALSLFLAGCGDSDSDFTTTGNNQNTSAVQVQFNRSNVLAQTAEFASATNYAVDVVNAGTRDYVRPTTFVAADTTQDLQVIVLTGLPVGLYDVIVTAFSNGVITGQVLARSVSTSTSSTVTVGTGSGGVALIGNTGAQYTVNFAPGQGPNTTTGTTTSTTSGGTGTTTSTGGTTGTTSTGGTTSTTGGTSSGTSGGYTTTGGYN